MSVRPAERLRPGQQPVRAAGPVVLAAGPVRVVVDPRAALVTGVLLVVAVGLVFGTLGTGPLPAAPGDVLRTVLGEDTGAFTFVVLDIGLPRALNGLLVGAVLGAAGSLVQALTRNPLGSPDVIGFDSGAAAGALVGLLVLHLSTTGAAPMALAGGAVAAGLVFVLSSGASDAGYRIVLIGIGVGAALDSVTAYLLTRTTAVEGLSAARWLTGSLNQTTWADVRLGLAGAVVLLPAAVVCARHLRVLLLGADTATALGGRVRAVTAATLLLAVALSAVAVLAAGPISFVALAAPQLAARLTGARRAPGVLSSAAMGAVLMAASDFAGQRLFGSTDLPVGVVTGAVGGIYLAWLLTRQWRRRA